MPISDEKKGSKLGELTPQERRRSLRFPFTAAVEIIEAKSGARINGRTSDLSLGGCYVDVMTPFPIGSEAQARILRGSESFEANVKVVYSKIGMGMGLAFVSAQPSQYRLFQRWIQEISGNLSPVLETEGPDKIRLAAESSLPPEDHAGDNVLHELLIALMRKQVLSEDEGLALLKKLPR